MKKFIVMLLAIALGTTLLAGCSGGTDKGEKAPAKNGQEQPAANNNSDTDKTPLQIYLTRDNQGTIETVPVSREVTLASNNPEIMAQKALELLMNGPSETEQEQGLSNAVPRARLHDLYVERPHVIINFSREFEQVGGTTRVSAIVDQLTYTMSAIPGIKSVILQVEGERVGTKNRSFTGEGLLFGNLTINPSGEEAAALSPADALDLFIALIPDTEKMWSMMGPRSREIYRQPGSIEHTAFEEGLGSWKAYTVVEESIEGDVAVVTIKGDRIVEGVEEPDAEYTAYMVKENDRWKWDFPPAN